MFDGDLLLLPEANPSVDDGFQPFDGRLGKLRYLALALMVATSPVSKEVAQLCMSFPEAELDPFDFDLDEKSSIKRAPVAYPILCSHVLTHTTGALIAGTLFGSLFQSCVSGKCLIFLFAVPPPTTVTGQARAEEGLHTIDALVDECRNFIQLGLIARVAQVILAKLRSHFDDDPAWEQRVCAIIEQDRQSLQDAGMDGQEWISFGMTILHSMLSPAKSGSRRHAQSFSSLPRQKDADAISSQISQAIDSAKEEAAAFLRDLSLICQIIIPNIFCSHPINQQDDDTTRESKHLFERYAELLGMEDLRAMLKSDLLEEIMMSWYSQSTGKATNKLEFPRVFHGLTWPVEHCTSPKDMPPTCLPLLGNGSFEKAAEDEADALSRILYLPKSYTDLYAELSEMCPDCEQTALCLVCGQVSRGQLTGVMQK